MTYLKNIGISFGFILGSLFGITLLITFFNYINLIGSKTLSVLEILTPLIALFIGGFSIGRKSKKKGWLEGLKLSGIFLVILILFQYLGLQSSFSLKNILFYVLIVASTVFGSMIGINKAPKME